MGFSLRRFDQIPCFLMRNLFVSTTFMPDQTTLRRALDVCLESGIRALEIGSNHCFEDSYDYLADYPFSYLVHNYFPIPEEDFVLNLASSDKDIRSRSIDHVKKSIDFCDEIGAKLYTFHPGFLTDPQGSNPSSDNYDFQWNETHLAKVDVSVAKSLMYDSIDKIVGYSTAKTVRIAIETEGSLHKRDHLLMQRPEEYEELFDRYSPQTIGVNLNIGHLNLAAIAFNFKKDAFVDQVQDYILAMELSHNDGIEDQHLPLQPNGWYWPLIYEARFDHVYKILEFRNIPIAEIKANIQMFLDKAQAV